MSSISDRRDKGLWISILRGYQKVEAHIALFGIVFFIAHATLLYCHVKGSYELTIGNCNGVIEVLACCISLMLWAHKYCWGSFRVEMKVVLWISSVLFLVPFWFSLMYLGNQDVVLWELALLVGLLALVFMVSGILVVPVILVGLFCGVIGFLYSNKSPSISPNVLDVLVIGIFAVAYFAFIETKRDRLFEEKLDFLKRLGGFIAHELRTPISSMLMGVRGIKASFPVLLDSYDKCNYKSSNNNLLGEQYLEILRYAPRSIEESGQEALLSIDMFLSKVIGISVYEKSMCDARSLIKEALAGYPLNELEKNLIHLDLDSSFLFNGNKVSFKHIIYNLLKNSLHVILLSGKGEIYISTELASKHNIVRFRDTSVGISKDKMSRIFEGFYSDKSCGTGLGLSFCKISMDEMDGLLDCKSEEDYYTEFTLKFPKIKTNTHQ